MECRGSAAGPGAGHSQGDEKTHGADHLARGRSAGNRVRWHSHTPAQLPATIAPMNRNGAPSTSNCVPLVVTKAGDGRSPSSPPAPPGWRHTCRQRGINVCIIGSAGDRHLSSVGEMTQQEAAKGRSRRGTFAQVPAHLLPGPDTRRPPQPELRSPGAGKHSRRARGTRRAPAGSADPTTGPGAAYADLGTGRCRLAQPERCRLRPAGQPLRLPSTQPPLLGQAAGAVESRMIAWSALSITKREWSMLMLADHNELGAVPPSTKGPRGTACTASRRTHPNY